MKKIIYLLLLFSNIKIFSDSLNFNYKLLHASANGKEEEVEEILKNGGDINFAAEDGYSVLMAATRTNNPMLLSNVLSRCPNINFVDSSGRTALIWSIIRKAKNAAKILLKNPYTNVYMQDVEGKTALHMAKENGLHDIAIEIVKHSSFSKERFMQEVSISQRDDWEEYLTGLLADCVCLGKQEEIELLFSKDINLNKQIHCGNTPLIWAALKQKPQQIKFLINNGADVNVVNQNGETALICAVENGDIDSVKEILNFENVDIYVKNYKNKGALEIARDKKRDDISQEIFLYSRFVQNEFLKNIPINEQKEWDDYLDIQRKEILKKLMNGMSFIEFLENIKFGTKKKVRIHI